MTTLIPKFDLMNGGSTPVGSINRPINQKLQEIVSVKDFGAKGDGTTDDTVAIQNAINSMVNTGGIVLFPIGKYLTTDTIYLDKGSKSVEGLRLVGEGNGDPSSSEGSGIYYNGAGGNQVAVIKTGSKDFVANSIENLTIDANNKAGYCLHLNTWGSTTHLNKDWTFNKLTFQYATTVSVFIGDDTLVGGVYTTTPLDSDAHLNVFNQCSFWCGTSTGYHVVLNVLSNCYQTTFNDCTCEQANTTLVNFLWQLNASQTVIKNLFAGAIFGTLGTETAVLRVNNGSLEVYGLKSEEARILYRYVGSRNDEYVSLNNVVVNQSSNRPDNGTNWKSIIDLSNSPLTLIDCYFFTGVTYRRIVETASTRLNTINAFVSADNALGIAPWVWQYPTLNAGWANVGGTYPLVAYRLGNNGQVQLQGVANGGSGTIFTLPAGYYLAGKRIDLPVSANFAFGEILIDTGGNVILNVGSASYVSLNNLNFNLY